MSYTGVEMGSLGELSFNLVGTFLDELIYVSGSGHRPDRVQGQVLRRALRHPEPGMAASLPHRLGDAVERGRVAHLALLRRRDEHRAGHGGQHRLRARRSRSYFDLAANWAVTEKASILLGINNVLDKDPPLSSAVGTTGNGNTFPQTYDALGRWIFLRGQVAF